MCGLLMCTGGQKSQNSLLSSCLSSFSDSALSVSHKWGAFFMPSKLSEQSGMLRDHTHLLPLHMPVRLRQAASSLWYLRTQNGETETRGLNLEKTMI